MFNISGLEIPQADPDAADRREEALLSRIYTREAALAMVEHLREDYETFHIAVPNWVQHATGELYDRPCIEELVPKTASAAIVAECAAANAKAGLAPSGGTMEGLRTRSREINFS